MTHGTVHSLVYLPLMQDCQCSRFLKVWETLTNQLKSLKDCCSVEK